MTYVPNSAAAGNPASPMSSAVPHVPPPAPTPRPEDERPVDLWGNWTPPPVPSSVLPAIIEAYAIPMARHMGTDSAGLVMSALTTCAAAIPDHIKLRVKRHGDWEESARIWAMLVGAPSTKKSPTMSTAIRPLAAIDAERVAAYERRRAEWEGMDKETQKATPEPLPPARLRIEDTTVEAAQEVLRASPCGVLMVRDELSAWFGSHDRYSGTSKSGSADRGFWLQAWNGGSMAVNRVRRGSALIPNLSVSIIGGIQPDAIRKVTSSDVDDGLLQRFFPIMLQPADVGEDAPLPRETGIYDMMVRALPNLVSIESLRFDPKAQAVFYDHQRWLHRLGAVETVNRKLAAHLGKLEGYFARLCVVWHVLDGPWYAGAVEPLVNAHTAHRVARFMREFLVPHALAFYSALGLSDDQDRLEGLANYILAKRLSVIDHRTVQRSGSQFKKLTKWETRPLFETLQALNWLVPIWTDEKRNGEPDWYVNSYVHTLYAEQGEREETRRMAAREAIRELSGRTAI